MRQALKRMKLYYILFLSNVCVLMASATDITASNLTVADNAFFGGLTSYGYSTGTSPSTGYTVDIYTGISTIEQAQISPGHTSNKTVWQDVYGLISRPGKKTWVENYGLVTDTITVNDYGPVIVQVWIPPVLDDQGNILESGHYVTDTVTGVIGNHQETVQNWGVAGASYQTEPGETYWGVVSSSQALVPTWHEEQRFSSTQTVLGVPIVRMIGQTTETVWSWNNLERELMELSPAGLSVPLPHDPQGFNKSIITPTAFEQSFSNQTGSGAYDNYGLRMQKDQLEAWKETGSGNIPSQSESITLKSSEILLTKETPTTSTVSSTTTRISAESSFFGGIVEVDGTLKVQGVIRVIAAGDVSMGPFTAGPTP